MFLKSRSIYGVPHQRPAPSLEGFHHRQPFGRRGRGRKIVVTGLRVAGAKIQAIHRSRGLNDSQPRKLELVGRGVVKHFIDSIAEQKQAFLSEGRVDRDASRCLFESPEVLALRKKLRDGPRTIGSKGARATGVIP
jgi:hypothetical protein